MGPQHRVLAARSRCASNNIGFSRVALVVVAVVVVMVVEASERRGEERRGEWGLPTAVESTFVSAHTKVKHVHVHSARAARGGDQQASLISSAITVEWA
jgi:uncharacterized DUF497 family protein